MLHIMEIIKDFINKCKSVKYIIDFCKSFNKKLYHNIYNWSLSGINLDSSYILQIKDEKINLNLMNLIYMLVKF